ncbi:hypothetical protein TomTYG75_06890 [Sphingobium sp. TomTYG75]
MTILASIVVDDDTAYGYHQLAAIPQHGDRLHLPNGDDILILTVERVDHYPVPAKHGATSIFGSITPAVTVFCRGMG